MFLREKEMIPVLIEKLSVKYNTKYFLEEFNTGNGIADIVFTTKLNDENIFLNNYGLMSTFVEYFYSHKWTNLKNELQNPRAKKLYNYLMDNSFIKNDNLSSNCITYKPHTENLISIEAKLKDWKSGFHQALRYQFYSQKSFLAISARYVHRVDVDMLKNHNIGLISVSKDNIKIILNPTSKKPKDIVSYCYLSECFATKLKQATN